MNDSVDQKPEEQFRPEAETLKDAESIAYKEETVTDPAHSMPTKSGAAAGAIAGAGVGTVVAGPVGAVVGAAIGLMAGAAAGRIAGEMFDPSGEVEYWQKHHGEQGLTDPQIPYTQYESAYRAGYNNYTPGQSFDLAEADVRLYYEKNGGASRPALGSCPASREGSVGTV